MADDFYRHPSPGKPCGRGIFPIDARTRPPLVEILVRLGISKNAVVTTESRSHRGQNIEQMRDAMEAELIKGLDSGPAVEITPALLADLNWRV